MKVDKIVGYTSGTSVAGAVSTRTEVALHNIDSIRLSEKQKTQLSQLKKKTGIDNWNVLCRWALCLSLAESTTPPIENIPSESNVEMSWKVFGGEHADIYLAILRQTYKSQSERLNNMHFHDFFKLHLNRGISFYLNSP